MSAGSLTTPWYLRIPKVDRVVQCQGRYLTTPWYLMTVRAKRVAWCHAPFMTNHTFGKLMMLLVTEDSRVLGKIF